MDHERVAILSVFDKAGIVDFARGLVALGWKILSTGGTASLLKEQGVAVVKISDYTGEAEMLDGRVKTLHPKIHGGLLLDRSNPRHREEASHRHIFPIDMVVVNLYDFAGQAVQKQLPLSRAIEFIDIGGPTMLRAAAKNFKNVLPIMDPQDYGPVLRDLSRLGKIEDARRQHLAQKTFSRISQYDASIADYFLSRSPTQEYLPENLCLNYKLVKSLRYGENPHQKASLYASDRFREDSFAAAEILQGKELSYNNYLDLDAACSLIADFDGIAALAIVKHTNPCGVACGSSKPLAEIFKLAFAADPKSAFGGIVATNQLVDEETARGMIQNFCECIAAPDFSKGARELLGGKKNLRLLKMPWLAKKMASHQPIELNAQGEYLADTPRLNLRSIRGGLLIQTEDSGLKPPQSWTIATRRTPSELEVKDLDFAQTVVKHVKSNGIVYASSGVTLAIGAGQMSRVDAVNFAARKAKEFGFSLKGSVMASDAFFPFRDCVDLAASLGVSAIVQPGGSLRDQESIEACDEHGMAMALTGCRHFRH